MFSSDQMMTKSSCWKASLPEQVFCLENKHTTIGLIQQNEKSTQVHQGKPWIRSPVVTVRVGEMGQKG